MTVVEEVVECREPAAVADVTAESVAVEHVPVGYVFLSRTSRVCDVTAECLLR